MKLSRGFVAGGLFQVAAAATGPNWPGFKGLRYLFAFGDSYTSIGFNSWASVPTDTNPLGVSYPGSTTAGGANWVGYLITKFNSSSYLSYDYAVSGNEVSGVSNQVNQDFLSSQGAGNKPSYAPWTATNSLFSTFIGINDLNRGAPIAATINTLFSLQETLYNTGARNFLFINVPPTNRCPFSNNNATLASLISSWNTPQGVRLQPLLLESQQLQPRHLRQLPPERCLSGGSVVEQDTRELSSRFYSLHY
ncbi:hypothetical protein RSAG8_06661, partial [Rhizoctonia solani AG-8 WAC10335]